MTERKDGRLMGRIYISKGKYKYVYASSKEELEEKLENARREIENEKKKSTLNENMLLSTYLDYYYKNIARVKESTFNTYKPYVEMIKKSTAGCKKVKDLTLDDFNKIIDEMPSPNAKKTAMNILKPSFEILKNIGIIEHNYTVLLHQENDDVLDSINEKKNKYISLCDFNKILSYANKLEDALALWILYFTGVRIGELCALSINDYDSLTNTLSITKQITSDGKLSTPKSRKSKREIECLPILKEKLKKYFSENINFSSMRSTINSILKRAAKDGYSYSVHDFRHSFATNCFLANRNPKIVQKELGHNSYEMTINTYTHLPKLDPRDLGNVKKCFTM